VEEVEEVEEPTLLAVTQVRVVTPTGSRTATTGENTAHSATGHQRSTLQPAPTDEDRLSHDVDQLSGSGSWCGTQGVRVLLGIPRVSSRITLADDRR
jgi:hypothetical protein